MVLLVGLVVGVLTAIALEPPKTLYVTGARPSAGSAQIPPPQADGAPDWAVGIPAGTGVVLVLAGGVILARKTRHSSQ